jgi:hypothetical protein
VDEIEKTPAETADGSGDVESGEQKPKRQYTRKKQPNLTMFVPREIEHYQFVPVEKSIIGRVWSKIRFSIWIDERGKEQNKAEFKLFIRSGIEKYRCECLFEQAEQAQQLQKYEWVRLTGGDYLVQTIKSKKIYHNFRVTKIEILPDGYGLIDWRPLFEMYNDLLEYQAELTERMIKIEKLLFGESGGDMTTKRDRRRMKKTQSLAPIVGDIYTDTPRTDEDPDDEDPDDEDDDDE